MKTFYAVFDTNVLVSSLLTKRVDSPTLQLLHLVFDGQIVLLYNDDIICEYEDVLHRGHFAFPTERVQELIDLVKTGCTLTQQQVARYFQTKTIKSFTKLLFRKRMAMS